MIHTFGRQQFLRVLNSSWIWNNNSDCNCNWWVLWGEIIIIINRNSRTIQRMSLDKCENKTFQNIRQQCEHVECCVSVSFIAYSEIFRMESCDLSLLYYVRMLWFITLYMPNLRLVSHCWCLVPIKRPFLIYHVYKYLRQTVSKLVNHLWNNRLDGSKNFIRSATFWSRSH